MFNRASYQEIQDYCQAYGAYLVIVTKDQNLEDVQACLAQGHTKFGENRFQEAFKRWHELSQISCEKHFIGRLQRNKVANIVQLFDVIQSVDRPDIAEEIAKHCQRFSKKINCFLQVNIGYEAQKSGVLPNQVEEALKKWSAEYGIEFTGLMAIPPAHQNPFIYFKRMRELADQFNIEHLSMGMSEDYKQALQCGSTIIRIGRLLFSKEN